MKNGTTKKRLVRFGIARILMMINRTPRVVFYHGVDNVTDNFVQSLHIDPDMFRKEMLYLLEHYEVISMDEYYRRFVSHSFQGKEVLLTFDDGYKNNLTIAAPILKTLSLPFTVFISTNHIGSGHYFPTFIVRSIIMNETLSCLRMESLNIDMLLQNRNQRVAIAGEISYKIKHSSIEKVNLICEELIANLSREEYKAFCIKYKSDVPMNWNDVVSLKCNYDCTIGSHCMDHFICNSFQSETETKKQILESKRIIEEKLGCPCDYFAYPNGNFRDGDITDFAMKSVSEAGYKLAFTTMNDRLGKNCNPYIVPRHAARFEMVDFKLKLALKPSFRF